MVLVLSDLAWAAVDYMTTHPAQAVLLEVALLFIAWKVWRLVGIRIAVRSAALALAPTLSIADRLRQNASDRRVFEAAKGRPISERTT